MDFGLAEEYRAFRDVARRWVDAEVPKSWARELEKDEHNYPFALWDKLTEAGFHGVGISEEYEGQGGDVIMQMVLARELSRSLRSEERRVGKECVSTCRSCGSPGN